MKNPMQVKTKTPSTSTERTRKQKKCPMRVKKEKIIRNRYASIFLMRRYARTPPVILPRTSLNQMVREEGVIAEAALAAIAAAGNLF
jgi:hypothetical protein